MNYTITNDAGSTVGDARAALLEIYRAQDLADDGAWCLVATEGDQYNIAGTRDGETWGTEELEAKEGE